MSATIVLRTGDRVTAISRAEAEVFVRLTVRTVTPFARRAVAYTPAACMLVSIEFCWSTTRARTGATHYGTSSLSHPTAFVGAGKSESSTRSVTVVMPCALTDRAVACASESRRAELSVGSPLPLR